MGRWSRRSRVGQVVAVVGEPGVGKSRLYWEFTHSHRTQGWLTLESASVSYGKATAYLPVLDLLVGYFQIEARTRRGPSARRSTGKLLIARPGAGSPSPAVLSLLDAPRGQCFGALDPPSAGSRHSGIKRLLLRESQVQPLLVLFEDLHWIDTETQALLDSLVESLPTARLLLLVNYRPEYQHALGQQDLLPPAPDRSPARPRAPTSSSQPARRRSRARSIEAGAHRADEGNPLFLEESVRTLVETEALAGERGA